MNTEGRPLEVLIFGWVYDSIHHTVLSCTRVSARILFQLYGLEAEILHIGLGLLVHCLSGYLNTCYCVTTWRKQMRFHQ